MEEWSNENMKSRSQLDKMESSKVGTVERSSSHKREQEQAKTRRSKKMRYEVIGEHWGCEQPTPITEKQEPPREPTVPREQELWKEPVLPDREPPLSPKEQRPRRRNKQSKLELIF